MRAKHRTHVRRLRCWDRCIRIAHLRPCDESTFEHELRSNAEECRSPEDQISPLADLDGSNLVAHAVGDCRINRVLCNITTRTEVVVVATLHIESTAFIFHLRGGLPCSTDHFT